MSKVIPYFAAFLFACLVCPVRVHAGPISAAKVTEMLDLAKRNLLNECANIAREIANDSPNDEAFGNFLRFVIDTGLIHQTRVAEFGRADPTEVSLWLNAENYPTTLVKEIVLIRISEEFEKSSAPDSCGDSLEN